MTAGTARRIGAVEHITPGVTIWQATPPGTEDWFQPAGGIVVDVIEDHDDDLQPRRAFLCVDPDNTRPWVRFTRVLDTDVDLALCDIDPSKIRRLYRRLAEEIAYTGDGMRHNHRRTGIPTRHEHTCIYALDTLAAVLIDAPTPNALKRLDVEGLARLWRDQAMRIAIGRGPILLADIERARAIRELAALAFGAGGPLEEVARGPQAAVVCAPRPVAEPNRGALCD